MSSLRSASNEHVPQPRFGQDGQRHDKNNCSAKHYAEPDRQRVNNRDKGDGGQQDSSWDEGEKDSGKGLRQMGVEEGHVRAAGETAENVLIS